MCTQITLFLFLSVMMKRISMCNGLYLMVNSCAHLTCIGALRFVKSEMIFNLDVYQLKSFGYS